MKDLGASRTNLLQKLKNYSMSHCELKLCSGTWCRTFDNKPDPVSFQLTEAKQRPLIDTICSVGAVGVLHLFRSIASVEILCLLRLLFIDPKALPVRKFWGTVCRISLCYVGFKALVVAFWRALFGTEAVRSTEETSPNALQMAAVLSFIALEASDRTTAKVFWRRPILCRIGFRYNDENSCFRKVLPPPRVWGAICRMRANDFGDSGVYN